MFIPLPLDRPDFDELQTTDISTFSIDGSLATFDKGGTCKLLIVVDFVPRERIDIGLLADHEERVLANVLNFADINSELHSVTVINFPTFWASPDVQDTYSYLNVNRIFDYAHANGIDTVILSGIKLFNTVMYGLKKTRQDQRARLNRLFRVKHNGRPFNIVGTVALHSVATDDERHMGTFPNLLGYFSRAIQTAILGRNRYTVDVEDRRIVKVDTLPKFMKFMKILRTKSMVAIDSEAENLGRRVNTLYSIQFSFDGKIAYFIPFLHPQTPFSRKEIEIIGQELAAYFEDNTAYFHIYHNGQFDITLFRIKNTSLGIRFYAAPVYDTLAGEVLLDENLKFLRYVGIKKPYSLEFITEQYGSSVYSHLGFSKEDRASMSTSLLDDDLIDYASVDTLVIYQIAQFQRKEARRRGYDGFMRFMLHQFNATIKSISVAEHTGVLADRQYLFYLMGRQSPIRQKMDEILNKFKQLKSVRRANEILLQQQGIPVNAGLFSGTSWIFDLQKDKHKQVLFFKVMRLKALSVRKDGGGKIDKAFQDKHKEREEVKLFNEYSKLRVLRDTFIGNSKKGLYGILVTNPDSRFDDRIRSTFIYRDVVTGRLSSRKPNLQNIAQHGDLAKFIKRIFIASRGCLTVKLDYCLTGDTLIPTENGLVRIDSLVRHTKGTKKIADIDMVVAGSAEPGRAVKWMHTGNQPVFRVTTRSGNTVKGTGNHKLRVLRNGRLKWIAIEDCRTTDYLCINRRPVVRKTPLPLLLAVSPTMTPELAYLLGAVMTGKQGPQGVIITRSKIKEALHLVNLAHSFGLSASIVASVHDEPRQHIVKLIVPWLAELGANRGTVPWSILQADGASQLAFLAGCSQLTAKLARGVRVILNSHGYVTDDRLLTDVASQMVVRDNGLPEGYGVKDELDPHYYFTPITKIKAIGVKPTYDLTMAKEVDHAFVANGLVVHNCAHEVREWANISGDRALGGAFLAGMAAKLYYRINPSLENKKKVDDKGDIHKLNYKLFFNRFPNNKSERNGVKSVVFGTIYGKGARSLGRDLAKSEVDDLKKELKKKQEELAEQNDPTGEIATQLAEDIRLLDIRIAHYDDEQGIEEKQNQAASLIEMLFTKFRQGGAFLKRTMARAQRTYTVQSPIGRVRHLWGYMHHDRSVHAAMNRRGPNSIIQGMSSDILIYAANAVNTMIWHFFVKHGIPFVKPDGMIVMPNNYIHDSIESDVPVHLIPIYAYLIEHACTTIIHRDYRRIFGHKMVAGLEIDLGFGAHGANIEDWDYNTRTEVLKDGKAAPTMITIIENQVAEATKLYPDYWTPAMIKRTMKVFHHNLDIMDRIKMGELREIRDRQLNPSEVMHMTEKNARSFGLIFEV